ncbi:hybrid sensor histidine kinase/response regulator [Desulfofustis glycolicus]|uniref:histidine kinase n=1 Tax=Desulfofustis glycolicus DSM 9705 TaxID=1121409 RepID=A0A1M5W985_9BACT|nr:response regulator [Desulfofustis glycolicus]SHH84139.1 PAS domain S-box-containing protein [Desulfofustis glycolicus DSM 9705]
MTGDTHILLVDDEHRFIESLQHILTHYGYACAPAYSGQQAIELLSQGEYDVALLDVGLPDISGLDVARHIRKTYPMTTSVMLTGINTAETAVQALRLGAYDFLNKPINHETLLRTLDRAIDHSRLQRELKSSLDRCQALADVAWEGIVFHADGCLLEGNKQFFRMFGYYGDEFNGDRFLDKIISKNEIKRLKPLLLGEDSGIIQTVGRHRNGTELPLEVKARTVDYAGRSAHVLIVRDMSERVKMEQENIDLHKKLAMAGKFKALGMMAGSVAHDLNNILTAVVSYPELLLCQMKESDRYYREIKKIQEAGKRAAAVVSDLVSIARGGSRKTEPANLNEIIISHLDSIEHNERLARFPEVQIFTRLQQNLHRIECSPPHINKLLLNLIGNALEAISGTGAVHLTTKNCTLSREIANGEVVLKPGKYVKLTVTDSGPGIPDGTLERIFDPFYSTKKTEKSGTGLGLTIVWNIVQDHKGWVDVKNGEPGAIFEIFLPACAASRETGATAMDRVPYAMGKDELILLVDDSHEQNMVMGEMLKILGYRTHAVNSGEKALDFLNLQPADVVILDMNMGDGLNGRQTYEQILKIRPDQKAIIVTGYSDHVEIMRAQDLGIAMALEKPVTFDVISRALRATIESPSSN